MQQKGTLIDFVRENKRLSSGKFFQQFSFKDAQRKWEDISQTLNSIPGARKDLKQRSGVNSLFNLNILTTCLSSTWINGYAFLYMVLLLWIAIYWYSKFSITAIKFILSWFRHFFECILFYVSIHFFRIVAYDNRETTS